MEDLLKRIGTRASHEQPLHDGLDAYIQRDPSGTIQRGCLMRSGSSMRGFMLRFVGRDASWPMENATVGEVLSGAGGGTTKKEPA